MGLNLPNSDTVLSTISAQEVSWKVFWPIAVEYIVSTHGETTIAKKAGLGDEAAKKNSKISKAFEVEKNKKNSKIIKVKTGVIGTFLLKNDFQLFSLFQVTRSVAPIKL